MPRKTITPRQSQDEKVIPRQSQDNKVTPERTDEQIEALFRKLKEYYAELSKPKPIEISFKGVYADAEMPKRMTKDSSGYDFFAKELDVIHPGETKRIDTGIKAKFPEDVTLLLFNRSSNPSKGLILMNGVGVVDSGYFNAKTNIMFEFRNITKKPVTISQGDKLGQGIFVKHLLISDDTAEGKRTGGFGSTGK